MLEDFSLFRCREWLFHTVPCREQHYCWCWYFRAYKINYIITYIKCYWLYEAIVFLVNHIENITIMQQFVSILFLKKVRRELDRMTVGWMYIFHAYVLLYNIVVVRFIGGGNRSTRRKQSTSRKSLTNFIT
jgi:hypothetical protein